MLKNAPFLGVLYGGGKFNVPSQDFASLQWGRDASIAIEISESRGAELLGFRAQRN